MVSDKKKNYVCNCGVEKNKIITKVKIFVSK